MLPYLTVIRKTKLLKHMQEQYQEYVFDLDCSNENRNSFLANNLAMSSKSETLTSRSEYGSSQRGSIDEKTGGVSSSGDMNRLEK